MMILLGIMVGVVGPWETRFTMLAMIPGGPDKENRRGAKRQYSRMNGRIAF